MGDKIIFLHRFESIFGNHVLVLVAEACTFGGAGLTVGGSLDSGHDQGGGEVVGTHLIVQKGAVSSSLEPLLEFGVN